MRKGAVSPWHLLLLHPEEIDHKKIVYRAISLKRQLIARGCRVIEVYPYITKVQLFGRHLPQNKTPAGKSLSLESVLSL